MIQVELHDRSNALVKVLGGAKNAAYHAVLNQDGTGTFLIHRADPDFLAYNILTGGIDRYLVHLLRKGPYEAAFTERFVFVVEGVVVVVGEQEEAGAWYRVSGRGTLCLLDDRLCFPPGYDGVSQATITAQFQTYAAQTGGEIMAMEIDRSNPRFALQFTHSKDTVGGSYSAFVLAKSPKAYWRLGEASGNFADSSGNAHTATPTGSPIYGVTGAILGDANKAVRLNGAEYLSVTDHADFATFGTVVTWVNLPTFLYATSIFGRCSSGLADGWRLEPTDSFGHIRLFFGTSTGQHSLPANIALTPGSWHQVAATWDGTTLAIYIDGNQCGTLVPTGTANVPGIPVIQIGRSPTTGGLLQAGSIIDEVAFYSTPQSAAQIYADYMAGAAYVSQSTVLQTVQLRFKKLHQLHDDLVSNGLDGQMVGLDYQALDRRGSDKSASVTVAMASQDSLLGATLERDASKVTNYIVAQGIGEGPNALLLSAQDASSIATLGRREGFLAANQDTDSTQISLRAASAVTQLKVADQRITTRFVDSPHTQLYRDFDLGDTIKLSVAPLNWTQNLRVVGITVTDQDSEVEDCALDLNSMRQEYLLKLATGAAQTSDGLGTVTRLPPAISSIRQGSYAAGGDQGGYSTASSTTWTDITNTEFAYSPKRPMVFQYFLVVTAHITGGTGIGFVRGSIVGFDNTASPWFNSTTFQNGFMLYTPLTVAAMQPGTYTFKLQAATDSGTTLHIDQFFHMIFPLGG